MASQSNMLKSLTREMRKAMKFSRRAKGKAIGWLISHAIERGRELITTDRGKRWLLKLLPNGVVQELSIRLLGRMKSVNLRIAINGLVPRLPGRAARLGFCDRAFRRFAKTGAFADYQTAIFSLIAAEEIPRAVSAISQLPPRLDTNENRNKLAAASLFAAFEISDYHGGVAAAKVAWRVAPVQMRSRYDYLKAAFSAGMVNDLSTAIEMVARQYIYIGEGKDDKTAPSYQEFIKKDLLYFIAISSRDALLLDILETDRIPNIGVFFLCSPRALGHVILDSYHFLALYRRRFDKIIFIGPPKSTYSDSTRVALEIVEQYATYCEISYADHSANQAVPHSGYIASSKQGTTANWVDMLLNISWMRLGEFSSGKITAVVENYWSLLRIVVHRTQEQADTFRHNSWFMTIPRHLEEMATQICAEVGVDLNKPLIVLHARDSGYHQIHKQAYRDSRIADYTKAIEWLLDSGYQVVRIGDRKMPKSTIVREGYHELPFAPGYSPVLDPVLISHAKFMIGCQSGPCAYARAFGIPVLSINAVFHYSLLPSIREMACFKRHFLVAGGVKRELSLDEALDADVQHLENGFQFESAGIEVVGASPEEIAAAAEDMVAWILEPGMPLTPEQQAFDRKVKAINDDLSRNGCSRIPIADYLGISLDGYRISPTVARMRAAACLREDTGSKVTVFDEISSDSSYLSSAEQHVVYIK